MYIRFGRTSRLTALGAGLLTAAALAVASAGPALADTTDTGGSATLSLPRAFIVSLARSSVIVLPGSPVTSSYAKGADAFRLPVTGGTGEVGNFSGITDMGGTLAFVNAKSGKTVAISRLELNFFSGTITGVLPGGTTHTTLAYIGGDMSTSSDPGPPATETFSADGLTLSPKAARALNTALGTTAFVKGTALGSFTTTFDVTIV